MNSGSGIGAGEPWRSTFPGGTFAYGCPPVDTPPTPPMNPFDIPPAMPAPNPFDLRALKPEIWALTVCSKCQRHVRVMEPCPWCLRADLDALKIALGDKSKPVEEIATMRAALQLAVDTLREVSRVVGSSRLDEVIAQCERALGP